QLKKMNQVELEVYGTPPDMHIRHGMRIYGLSMCFAIFATVQWIIIGYFSEWRRFKIPQVRYGYWLMITFFGICMLSCTPFGRKLPYNLILIAIIVESSTLFIAFEQQNTRGVLVNVYAGFIVISLVVASIVFGAYFPMRLVPSDLALSIISALALIMLAIFFLNAYIFGSETVFIFVRNYFAIAAITMIMYAATIIHDRQFNVPKNEYLYLSVLIFFGHMILHERILALSMQQYEHLDC
ncbi:hypothetical protein KR222_009076, partial [Zaprionus bogoriensis]